MIRHGAIKAIVKRAPSKHFVSGPHVDLLKASILNQSTLMSANRRKICLGIVVDHLYKCIAIVSILELMRVGILPATNLRKVAMSYLMIFVVENTIDGLETGDWVIGDLGRT